MAKELNELEKITLLGVKQVLTTEDVMLLTGLSVSTLHKLTSRCYLSRQFLGFTKSLVLWIPRPLPQVYNG